MNKKQFMGLVTVSLIIGGTIYCIKKYKEDLENGEPISLEEAKALVASRKEEMLASTEKVGQAFGMERDEIEELVDDARDEAGFNSSFHSPDISYDFYDDVDWNHPLSSYITEEDKKLRFEPNSMQARDQFIKMELADLTPGMQEYQIMKRLFDCNFEPLNDGDGVLYSQLADYRMEFFGPNSRWNDNVTMGDIVTHYARVTDYNIGGGIGNWIVSFVRNTELSELGTNTAFGMIISDLNQHSYHNRGADIHGLFGLTFEQSLEAEEIASESVDGMVTYEIEFNEFLKNQ